MKAVLILLLGACLLPAQLQLLNRPVPSPAEIERGKAAFVSSCGFCHGVTARGGDGGPDLVRSVVVLDDEQGNLIGPVILNGRSDRGMPSFSMTGDQIRDIAAFLRERTQAAANRSDYQILDIVTGDAGAGRAFFNSAGKCSGCHSTSGDLAKVGSKYDPVALQERFLFPRPRAKLAKVTVTPPKGPAVSGILERMDDFSLAVRDSEGYYHSFARDSVKAEVVDPLSEHANLLRRYTDANIHDILAYLVTLK